MALAREEDRWHATAVKLRERLARARSKATHALALGEAVAVIGSAAGGKAAQRVYSAIHDTMEVRLPTHDDLDHAMAFVLRFDGKLSLSDALFLHYMQGNDVIVSFDADFDRAGVVRVPGGKHAKG